MNASPLSPLPAPYADIFELIAFGPEGNAEAEAAVRRRDALLTKPQGSLGRLEDIVAFLARWQGKPTPTL
ncbi:MAG: nicotinate-nucleotide--dimethylbenzimidazole phosphoribosyltransferase, partial [Devosia sp.]